MSMKEPQLYVTVPISLAEKDKTRNWNMRRCPTLDDNTFANYLSGNAAAEKRLASLMRECGRGGWEVVR
jgi:hypothetical protein